MKVYLNKIGHEFVIIICGYRFIRFIIQLCLLLHRFEIVYIKMIKTPLNVSIYVYLYYQLCLENAVLNKFGYCLNCRISQSL